MPEDSDRFTKPLPDKSHRLCQVTVIADNHGNVEQIIECVHKEMGGKVYV